MTSLLSTFISNSATAILVAPIAWAAAEGMGVNPQPFMMAAAVAASACFATPICTPPNAMVMNAGQYTFMDYVKVGLPLQVIMGIVAILCIPLLFPF
ncbi:Sodium/sulfate symporter [gut metagenome]|uniref:Sodium/sulfate symporter n=1 Tax=gut metagenome TaxID=749906 RepID=J9FHI6_9ZZZZ